MRRSDQIDSTHVVLIPEVKIPLNLVVAAMSDGGRFLAVGGSSSQRERSWKYSGDMSGVVNVNRLPVVVFLRC